MTDTERLVTALESKAAIARKAATDERARGNPSNADRFENRADCFDEAAAMARHPSMLAVPRPAAVT